MTHALLTLVLLAATLSASATPIELPRPNEKWSTLQVDELTFVSSVSASETMEIARDLLQMREAAGRITNLNVRSSKPVRIILFASESAFAPYREAISGVNQASVRGIFTGSDSAHFIVMVHDGAYPIERTVYHELTHYFLRNSVDGIPLWANEGAAEYYSTFRSSVDAVQVGHPILEYLQVLRSEQLLPLRKLLATTAQSPHYRHEKQGIFHAQSWALFHRGTRAFGEHRPKAGERGEEAAGGFRVEGEAEEALTVTLGEQKRRDVQRRHDLRDAGDVGVPLHSSGVEQQP